ncbi:MAG: HD domain-containing protein [Candidatus Doudnabacteria bacterium]|nr:HD domain-containing protein [Candidatus Doudnabacteria bacterium]
MEEKQNFSNIVDFLFEVGILAKTPRSGFNFLGSGDQSVSEHVTRTVFIGYTLAMLSAGTDASKVLKMCLLHDISETRISDLNYVHQQYTERFEDKAQKDLTERLPFGGDMNSILDEYHERKSAESLLAKDADSLEWLLSLKEQYDAGNKRADTWMDIAIKRLKTDLAKTIAKKVLETDSNHWWFDQKDNDWWVNRIKGK